MKGDYKQHYVNKYENVCKIDCKNCQNLEKIEHLKIHGTIIFNKDQTVVINLP